MGVEQYIKELLYRYNCVIIPGFGAFLTQKESAVLHKTTNAFYPPTKVISFNEQLSLNDGLLVSYMATAEKFSYGAMLQKLNEVTEEWKQKLEDYERISLVDIGELWLNKEGRIQFLPSYRINYLTSSFGLSSFVSAPITTEVLKEDVVEVEEKIPFIITPKTRETTSVRPYLKYAAILFLTISTGVTSFSFFDKNQNKQQLIWENVDSQISKNIQQATFFNTAPLELPSFSLQITKKGEGNISEKTHYIVAGAFRIERNAIKKIRMLKNRGFDASYVGINKFGLHQVSFASFDDTDVKEARQYLIKIRQTENDAWMLSLKN